MSTPLERVPGGERVVLAEGAALYGLDDLPCLPEVLREVLDGLAAPAPNLMTLQDLLQRDPVLNLWMLAQWRPSVSDLEQPLDWSALLARVGPQVLHQRLLALAARQLAMPGRVSWPLYDTLWLRQQTVARWCRAVAIICRRLQPQWAFVAGLGCDLGQFLQQLHHGHAFFATREAGADARSQLQRERELLGTQHCEVAAKALRQWGLPWVLTDAVLYHHESLDQVRDAHPLVQLVCVAVELVESAESRQRAEVPAWFCQRWGISPAMCIELLNQCQDEVSELAERLGIAAAGELVSPLELSEERILLPGASAYGDLATRVARALQAGGRDGVEGASLDEVLIGLQGHLGATSGLLWVFSEEQGESGLHVLAPVRRPAGLTEMVLDVQQSGAALARAWSTQLPVLLEKESSVATILDRQLLAVTESEAMLCVPLHKKAVWMLTGNGNQCRSWLESGDLGSLLQTLEPHLPGAGVADASGQWLRELYHEVSNPLTVIRNYLATLRLKHSQDEVLQGDVARIEAELARTVQLLGQLRQGPGSIQVDVLVDVNAVIQDTLQLMRPALLDAAGVRLVMRLDERMQAQRVDANRVRQVVINLIKNAAENLPSDSVLTVATSAAVFIGHKRYARIRIADDGPGLPPGVTGMWPGAGAPSVAGAGRDGLQDTTSRGLGLAIVRRLVEEMDGLISCETDSEGTRYEIYLPYTQ